jgi:hypothetical protein
MCNCKNSCKCNKLITSQTGPAGINGIDGIDGIDGIIKWKDLNLECLETNNIIEPSDENDDISQKLVNFWCESQQILFTPPTAYGDTYSVEVNNILTFNPTMNDDYMSAITVEIITGPVNGTASVSILNNKSITYTPNTNFIGSDTIVYKITDNVGQTSTATISIVVMDESTFPCVNIVASSIADLSVYGGQLKIQLVNTTDYETNTPDENDYLIEVRDDTNTVLYSYNVIGNNNIIPQSFITPQSITSLWNNIKITQTVKSKTFRSNIPCSTSTTNKTYDIPNIQVSMYTNVDVECLGVDSESNTDSEITQALVDAACGGIDLSPLNITVVSRISDGGDASISLNNHISLPPGWYPSVAPNIPSTILYWYATPASNLKPDTTLQVLGDSLFNLQYTTDHSDAGDSGTTTIKTHGEFYFYLTNGLISRRVNLVIINNSSKSWIEETLDTDTNTWDITGQDLSNGGDYSLTSGKRIWKLEDQVLKVKYYLKYDNVDSVTKLVTLLFPVITPTNGETFNSESYLYQGHGTITISNKPRALYGIIDPFNAPAFYFLQLYTIDVSGDMVASILTSSGSTGYLSYEIDIPIKNQI